MPAFRNIFSQYFLDTVPSAQWNRFLKVFFDKQHCDMSSAVLTLKLEEEAYVVRNRANGIVVLVPK